MASLSRSRSVPLARSSLALATLLALAATPVRAQEAQTVQVTGHGPSEDAGVTGFSQPLSRTPIQAEVIDAKTLADIGATSLSDLSRIDASVIDAYNAVGYWTTFSLRGFQVDNRYNFRRDGLPINAETMLPLENKSGVEILKGLSGMQAGTSAPGGLVNLVVKRPDADLRTASLGWQQDGTVSAAVDLSQRFGAARDVGVRVNASVARLDPNYRDAEGHRNTASIATDWRITRDSLLEFEFEHSLQSQPSVPAFSTFGRDVPDPHSIDPHVNLNDQPWSQPVVMQGNTMSLRFTQTLTPEWRVRVQALQQKLVSNDHLAFAFGLYDPVTYECEPYCHSFSSDGHFSIWDFRSDDERRTTRDLDASLSGAFSTGPLRHAFTLGALETIFTARFQDSAYNLVGVGSIDGSAVVPADPSLTSPNTDRTERSTELYLRDTVSLGDWNAWLGLRHTRLHRQSSETATGTPDDDTDYRQSFTTPWLALSRQFGADDMAYASWGKGIESDVAPTFGVTGNRGQALASTQSRQWELGWKHGRGADHWGVDVFDVQQAFDDVVGDAFVHDGITHSRGVEAEAQARVAAWTLRASAMWQRVRREDALDPANDGLRPTNVPDKAIKLLASYAVAQVPGLTLLGNVAYEGAREVFPENDAQIPGWTRYDLALRYAQTVPGASLVWRAGVNNVFDRRAWREAPYQYDHAYLFPLEPRTFFASVEASF